MNLQVEVGKDFKFLKNILLSKSKDNYPYTMDDFFDVDKDIFGRTTNLKNSFILFFKFNNNIIGTYAAKKLPVLVFYEYITGVAEHRADHRVNLKLNTWETNSWYSSCQWIDLKYRGSEYGVYLDKFKKNLVFDLFSGDINYALHKERLTNYHLKNLRYTNSDYLMTYDNGIGGAGTQEDTKYNICYINKQQWKNVKELY